MGRTQTSLSVMRAEEAVGMRGQRQHPSVVDIGVGELLSLITVPGARHLGAA